MIADIAVPVRLLSTFHYKLTLEMADQLTCGSVVEVPFGKRTTHAFVLGLLDSSDYPIEKLKEVSNIIRSEPIFDTKMLKFLKWVSEYYCHPIGEVIATALPKHAWMKSKPLKEIVIIEKEIQSAPLLNEEQKAAVALILAEDKPVLLHGVTGSGKTEVYISVLQETLKQGKTGLVLVPEIALTPQLLNRFESRFPNRVAILHSNLLPSDRRRQWQKIIDKKADIVIGARSAVFAPLKNLGLIIVDEEHESSYKQEDTLRYHGRDLAIVRASQLGAKVVLGSATPSLESYQNALTGKYAYSVMKKRVHERPLPKATFVDLKDPHNLFDPKVNWMSQELINRIRNTLSNGNQTMLFLNRLGFSHFLFCEDCGHTYRCRNCDVALTYYQHPPILKCHYCNYQKKVPEVCSECQGNKVNAVGLGTEQVEKKMLQWFPNARIERMDRGRVKNKKELESILERMHNREIDILIGTQMIAKGHDFPGVALVGILLADASLNIPDFRSNEKTFQIINQVSGRAGRAEVLGEVVIQSFNPEHPVLKLASENQYEDFYRMELNTRRQFFFPPFARLAMLRFQHKNLGTVEEFSQLIIVKAKEFAAKKGMNCLFLGPSEAPLSRLKNLYRWQALVKSDSVKDLHELLRALHEYVITVKSPVGVAVDVDPLNSM